jgi:hypothetical protein
MTETPKQKTELEHVALEHAMDIYGDMGAPDANYEPLIDAFLAGFEYAVEVLTKLTRED